MALFCNYENLKKCSKVLARRFAIELSRAQDVLARAGGYASLHHLRTHLPLDVACIDGQQITLGAWRDSLRHALGDDLDELVSPDEIHVWWTSLCVKKVDGPSSASVEAAAFEGLGARRA